MTDAELDQIEGALGVTLPVAYRQLSLQFPFRAVGNDWVYWMYDDAERVIAGTQFPLEDGGYKQANWKSTFVVIGQSASGDPYLLDVALPDSPVYYLSHEDHSLGEEWPDLTAFVTYWEQFPEEARRQAETRQDELRTWHKNANRIFLKVMLFAVVLPLALLVLLVLLFSKKM